MKFPLSKQPCIIMFLCLFLHFRLFCAMRVTGFLRSVYIVIFFSSCPLCLKTTVTAGKKIDCPLKNNCLTSSVVYNANITIESDTTGKNYIGLTEGTFKQRYAQHKLSFRNRNYSNSTQLSKHIWTLNDSSTTPILQLTGVF